MHEGCYPLAPVVLADDNPSVLRGLGRTLKAAGIDNLVDLQDSRTVMQALGEQEAAVLLLDLNMPNMSGEQLLPLIRSRYPDLPVIVVTGNDAVATAVECIKLGAFDYLVKPPESTKLVTTVRRAIEMRELREEQRKLSSRFMSDELEKPEAFARIITQNARMKSVFRYMEAIAPTTRSALITGETGVGKELVAEALHLLSGRTGPYIPVNIASFDEAMLSGTLFGHRKGAFTGADQNQEGLVAAAAGGTLFLDEIGELNPNCQVKLLRLLESGEYLPLGSSAVKRSEARIVVATNRDLEQAIEAGTFRKDLYYRLRSHHIHIPPLRERLDDLPLLVDHLVRRAARELGRETPAVSPELLARLEAHPFPGNVRELESMLYEAISRDSTGTLLPSSLGERLATAEPELRIDCRGAIIAFPQVLPTLRQVTDQLIEEALRRADGNQTRAARQIGITQQALSSRLRRNPPRAGG